MVRIKEGEPQFIIKGGKPIGVILDILSYEELLEQLEDREDFLELEELRKKPLKFRPFEDFLKGLEGV